MKVSGTAKHFLGKLPQIIVYSILFYGLLYFSTTYPLNRRLDNSNEAIKHNTEEIVRNTDKLIELEEESKKRDEALKNYLFCILLVPPEERTNDVDQNCRKTASERANVPPEVMDEAIEASVPAEVSQHQASQSSGQSTPPPDNEGIITPQIFFIPPINIPSPF